MKRHHVLIGTVVTVLMMVTGLVYAQGTTPERQRNRQAALGTAFTYQGRLSDEGQPLDDTCALTFELYDDAADGTLLGTEEKPDHPIVDGYFTVQLDFGAGVFDGGARWLAVQVQCSGDAAPVDLGRQALAAAPYALHALGAPWSGLRGVPADLADGDDDTTYSAGSGLSLTGTTFSVVTDTVQQRVEGTCPVGSSIRVIYHDGTVACEEDDLTSGGGGGDVTAVHAGDGLMGGGVSGEVTVTVAFSGTGTSEYVARADHHHDARYYTQSALGGGSASVHWDALTDLPHGLADGDDVVTYTAGSGLVLSDAAFSVLTDTVQQRVADTCPAGSSIRVIHADGTVTCQVVGGGAGDITGVEAGVGLSGGGDSGDVTLSIDGPYRLPQACANGEIAEWTGTVWACGTDDVGSGGGGGDITAVNAGAGLTGGGDSGAVTLDVDFAGSGIEDTAARSDHEHDARYYTQAQLSGGAASVHWDSLTDLPAGLDDGDQDTLAALAPCADGQTPKWYAGTGEWDCGDDQDTTYTAGAGLQLSGSEFSADFAGTGSAETVSHSDHDHHAAYVNDDAGEVDDADIAVGALSPDRISGTAWTGTNDGSGSSLDADLLDGQDASAFAEALHDHLGETWTGGNALRITGTFDEPGASAPLVLRNTGGTGGHGLEVNDADLQGVQVQSAGGAGFEVVSTGWHGLYVVSSAANGVMVSGAEDDGFHITTAGSDGVYVSDAGDDGVSVARAENRGVAVRSAGGDGVYVCTTGDRVNCSPSGGNHGVEIGNTQHDGVRIINSEGDGLHVTAAGGSGLAVESASGSGVHVDWADGDGLRVDDAGGDALGIGSADGDGVHVGTVDDGLEVYHARRNGVFVTLADEHGVYVDEATWTGMAVGSAQEDGFRVCGTGGQTSCTLQPSDHHGLEIGNAQDDGVHVTEAGGDGVYVGDIGGDGVFVNDADSDGVRVRYAGTPAAEASSMNNNGFEVNGAQGDGLFVGGAGGRGVNVVSAGGDGLYVCATGSQGTCSASSSGNHGLEIGNAQHDGVHVTQAGDNGLEVIEAGSVGVRVEDSGSTGVVVESADGHGVYAHTTATYGFYTPDKIYAGDGYDDIAEHIDATGDVEPGDVVVIDPHHDERVVKSTQPYDTAVAGIISTEPAMVIGKSDTETPLALAGRVLCKVSAENGPIHRGDLLTTSSTPGHAMKAAEPTLGTILGKAMGELESGTGVITVLVTLQ